LANFLASSNSSKAFCLPLRLFNIHTTSAIAKLDRSFEFPLYDQTIMPKRVLDEGSSTRKAKKIKFADEDNSGKAKEQPLMPPSNLTTEEVDFPRGGGSSFTPIEVKALRAEALREADSELFEVCAS
jgi:hypothetical protein